MAKDDFPWIRYPEVGACGLGCRLCPSYHSAGESPCGGCKSEYRMNAGCPILNCALKRKGVEFCWECDQGDSCEKWRRHLQYGRQRDSFKCYQTEEKDVAFIREKGVARFEKEQKIRQALLEEMLGEFNEGRSKSYYCIAATVMEPDEIRKALGKARRSAEGLDAKGKAKLLHGILDDIAKRKGYLLKLRK